MVTSSATRSPTTRPVLPDKLESVVYVPMEAEQQRLYAAHERYGEIQSERFFPYPFSKPWEPASLRSLPIADPSQKSYTTDETGCFANRGIPNRSAHAWLCSCRTLCCARGSQYRDSKP